LILALQKKIPIFLIEYIYKDFLEADFIYQKFINVLECEQSQKLNIQPLFYFIKIIFHKNTNNSTIIPYICKSNDTFNIYYRDHYIDIVKHFIHMDTEHLFTACILMASYH